MRTLILTKTAARILDMCEKSVRDMADRGALPAERTESGTRLFRREDVERLAADRGSRSMFGVRK